MRTLRILVAKGRVDIEPRTETRLSCQPPRLARVWPVPSERCNRNFQSLDRGGEGDQTKLTPREIEVLKFVAEGLTNGQTAVEMKVSIKTVQKHRQAVMNKLNLHDTAGLTRYAVTWGILFDNPFCGANPRERHHVSEDWWIPPGATKWITARETQVLKFIANGLVNKQIASELNISIKTVEGHRQGLMNRLNIHQVAGLTRYAISQGLVPVRILVSSAAPGAA